MGHSRCHRWAVVLAEGGAQRLQPLTRRIAGDDRPKQVCAVLGGQTLSHQTLLRTGRLAPTVPAIPYSLMCLHNIDARAVAAFFPSDHHFSDHAAFLDHMKIAFQAAESHPGSVVLLGAKAATHLKAVTVGSNLETWWRIAYPGLPVEHFRNGRVHQAFLIKGVSERYSPPRLSFAVTPAFV
jgi:hypothetical protein